MEKPDSSYRDNLAAKLKQARELDPELAQGFLVKQEATPEYQEARSEKLAYRAESKKDEERIEELQEELTGESTEAKENKESKENKEKVIYTIFEDLKKEFQNEKEYGIEGKKAALKVEKIEEELKLGLNALKQDYLKEYQTSGMKPSEFMREYGICSIDKDHGGMSWLNLNQFSTEEQKEFFQGPKKNNRSFMSFSVPIFNKYDWKKESRKLLGKWKAEEIHEEWFTPKQEKAIYSKFIDAEEFDKSKDKFGGYASGETTIPGVTIHLGEHYQSMNEKETPIHKGLLNRWYGWKRRSSFLGLEKAFVENMLNEVIE